MPDADEVIVVGDALLDVSVAPSGPMRPGGDVPAAVRLGPGGQGANVAVRLARRGVPVRLACALGDDAAGRLVRDALDADGVDVDAAPADATGAVVIIVDADGERTMLSHRVPLLPRAVSASAWTVVSGYLLLEEGELDVAGDGRRAVLGCALPAGSETEWWQRARACRPDVVILNAGEARSLGTDAGGLARAGGALVVITDRDGAVAAPPEPGRSMRRAAVERVSAVDTTGSGDAFAAAFLAELHDLARWTDADVDRALTAGLELAAQVARVVGAQAAVPIELGRARV
jgi:sugar/nucleoside kinase (ribokinase family)